MAKYNIVYADPPWSYNDKKCEGAAERQYKCIPLKDLCALPIKELLADDAILFLWATYPKIEDALILIKAWGFAYKSIAFQWVKLNKRGKGFFFGLGRWTRGNTEPCLIAVKGKPKRISPKVSQLIFSPLQKHSTKPAVVREKIIELIGDLPRIELFAREKAFGWDCLGNEIDNKDIRQALEEKINETR